MRSPKKSVDSSFDPKAHPIYKRPLVLLGALLIVAAVVIGVVLYFTFNVWVVELSEDIDLKALPDGFLMGTATSAYQIEGAFAEDGKGQSIWDNFTHKYPERIADHMTGDVACDSYHQYKRDVQMIKELGFSAYRFSLSWTRILPNGKNDSINQLGLNHYTNLIDELIANGIQPVVTIYHWDLPQALEDLGGWLNPDMADYFRDYCDVCFKSFGDKVKWWVTINEFNLVRIGYGGASLAPGLNQSGTADYLASHHLLRAHAKAFHLYNNTYRATQQGKVGVALHAYNIIPLNFSDPEDVAAAYRANQFQVGIYLHPIFTAQGDYPPVVRERVDNNSKAEGRATSRLPTFTAQEVQDLRGSADFLGLNHYYTKTAISGVAGDNPSIDRDSGAITSSNEAPASGFRQVLNWMKNEYDNPTLLVTENGCDSDNGLEDTNKVEYYHNFVGAMLEAFYLDKCNIVGYTMWSLMDNFEWYNGYSKKFGLWSVDFNNATRPRTVKSSGLYVQQLLKNRRIPDLPSLS